MKKFKVQFSYDGLNWEEADNGAEFVANSDPHNKVKTTFAAPFVARSVRINPTEWNNHISLRFEVYFSDHVPVAEEGNMSVAAVQAGFPVFASDEWDAAHSIHRSRLDFPKPRQGSSSWCAGVNNQEQWIGVDLVTPKLVTTVETQGRGNHNQWVTAYSVSYSLDGINWEEADEGSVFAGNANKNGRVVTTFATPF